MSRLTSRSFEHPPALTLRCRMWLHHLICVWCRRYTSQLQFLRRTAPRLDRTRDGRTDPRLSAEAKRRMVERLNRRDESP